jgi:hypothetical protein
MPTQIANQVLERGWTEVDHRHDERAFRGTVTR